MTQEQELSIINSWAKTCLPRVYDEVTFYKQVNHINYYVLSRTEWGTSRKKGLPKFAIIKNENPVLITDIHEILNVLSF